MIRVTVWNENVHEQHDARVQAVYPEGIHGCIAGFLGREADLKVRVATLDQPEHGLTEEVLRETDVLTWWGHRAHGDVKDEIVQRVQRRVLEGMGLLVLHSGHYSKIFQKLCGTSCSLIWRVAGERELIWVCNPGHPIVQGVGRCVDIPSEEMYGEPFDIPNPDEVVTISWFEGGEVFRSGVTFKRGNGRIFYFRPGHETFPTYRLEPVQRIITNAVRWLKPEGGPRGFPQSGPTHPAVPLRR